MKHTLLQSLRLSITALALNGLVFITPTVAAFDGTIQGGANAARGNGQASTLFGNAGIFSTITNVLLFILGAISVIMIIIGGLRYVISGGNTANVTAAKNTILYAIVGVVIALLSYAIINFVLGSFSGNNAGGTNV
jgi:hypothetical protein